jgi:RND family efflux transporter MFP subunit
MRYHPFVLSGFVWSGCFLWVCAAVALLSVPADDAYAQPSASELDCVIEPHQVVKLASPVVGVIARLNVDRGDIVEKGQILGNLENGVEVASLALARARASSDHSIRSAQARLDYLRKKSGRAGELMARNFASQATADEAAAELRVAEEQLREARLNLEIARLDVQRYEQILEQRRLTSPINGVVVERILVPGEYRNEQTPILTLAQTDPLRVEVFVPTSLHGQIRVGTLAIVMPEKPIGGAHTAVVSVVDSVFDAASGTFGVRLQLPNPNLRLPAGIRCRIQFPVMSTTIDQPAATAMQAPNEGTVTK